MLVIISDLHLTDGTSGATIQSDAFEIFKWRLRNLAYAASCRMLGSAETYQPIDDLYLLLLGDTLDTIRSTSWLRGTVRPWDDDHHSKEFVDKVRGITADILDNNWQSLEVFRTFNKEGIFIPRSRGGQDSGVGNATAHNVKVHIFYLVGNHDWFYHLPGSEYNDIRASIVEALGLSNDPACVFPHDTEELEKISTICRAHHVFARHGDVFDANNFQAPSRDRSSMGDAVVIELVDKFAHQVEQELGPLAPKGLRDIDNVRPLELVPAWVAGLLRRSDPKIAGRVREIWNKVAEDFLSVPFVAKRRSYLKWGLRLSEGVSFSALGRIVPRAKDVMTSFAALSPALNRWLCRRGLSDDFSICALGEKRMLKDPDISYIVYGHTHRHEIVPLRIASMKPGRPKAAYLNSGTWRAVFDRARSRPKDNEFFGYHVMTYLSFFDDEERKDREFETWSGSFESPLMRGEARLYKVPYANARAA